MRSIWGGDLGPKFCPNWRQLLLNLINALHYISNAKTPKLPTMYITGKLEISTLASNLSFFFVTKWCTDVKTRWVQQMKSGLSFQLCCCNFYCTFTKYTCRWGWDYPVHCSNSNRCHSMVLYNLINLHTRSVWETICNARASYASRIFGLKSCITPCYTWRLRIIPPSPPRIVTSHEGLRKFGFKARINNPPLPKLELLMEDLEILGLRLE